MRSLANFGISRAEVTNCLKLLFFIGYPGYLSRCNYLDCNKNFQTNIKLSKQQMTATNSSNFDEQNIFLARVAEQAERFDDMVSFLEKVLDSKGSSVNSDERNLLSVAFKNLISGKRAACRTISAIEQNPKYAQHMDALIAYKTIIETKLIEDCERIIRAIQDKVLGQGECEP